MTTRAITRMRTLLNRRYGWEDRVRGEPDGAELGISTLVIGRIAAIIFIVCGLLGLVGLLLPTSRGADSLGVIIASATGIIAGIITTFLPWHRWPRWHTHWLTLVGFGLIGLGISFYGEFAYAFGAMFCICFTAVGLAHRAGTSLLMLPLFMAAYAAPIAVRTGDVALAVSFAVFTAVLCVMVAEIVSWVTSRLYRSQMALLSAHAAVNDISADLTSMDAVGLAQKASVRLCKLLDASEVSVYTLADDGQLICLAGITDGRPWADLTATNVNLSSWRLASDAVATKDPVLQLEGCPTLVIPLVARGRVVGLVEVTERRPGRSIASERVADARSVCRLIALSIQDAEALAAQEAQTAMLASMLESSRAVTSADELEDALVIVARRAAAALAVSECVAYEYMHEIDAIVPRAMWEKHPTGWDRLGEVMPLADYVAERTVLAQGIPLLENVSDPGLDVKSRETMIAWNERSCLTVPMRSADGPMGLLVFWDPERERHYTPDEMALAVGLAELAGEAVRRARLVRSLQRLSGTDSLTGLANHRQIHELLNREQARAERHGLCFNLVMLDIDGFKLLNDTYGHPCGDTALRHIAAILQANARASDVVGRYAGDEFVLILSEIGAEEAYVVVEKMRAAIAQKPFVTPTGEKIPMHASFGIATFPDDGQGVNELVVAADSNLYVSKRRGGNAITGAGHVDLSEGEEKTSFGILESMVTAVDNKDRYTRRHSEQVTELALVLGNALGLSEGTLRILRAGGLLHDVGKIGIPDRILRKPGPLTPEEWAIVKGHPSMGETLIRTMPDLSDIQALVASHHECFDGTGYPRGLSGRDIPLLARILTVADSFSAMIADRPYRKALSRNDAVFELRKGAGTHFDPAIVSTFIQCIEGPFEGRLEVPFEGPSPHGAERTTQSA
jgi:diguanylate cyclase (GGDEF)-like protein